MLAVSFSKLQRRPPAKATDTSFPLHLLLTCFPFIQLSPLADRIWSGYVILYIMRNMEEKTKELILRYLLQRSSVKENSQGVSA